MPTYISVIIISSFLSACFSGIETAFTSLTRLQQHVIIAKYPIRGKILQKLLANSSHVLNTVLITNTTANATFSITISLIVTELFGNQFLAITTGAVTLFLLIFCEISPKQFSLHYNEQILLRALIPLYAFQLLLFPISLILNGLMQFMHAVFFHRTKKRDKEILTRKHLASLFYTAHSLGDLESENAHAITRILNFQTLTVESIMLHRTSVTCFSSSQSIADVESIIKENTHFYYPVYEDNNTEHIIGVVELHDIISERNRSTAIQKLTRRCLFIPKSKSIHDVLETFKEKEKQIAVILDEFGGFAGIVSIKDIMHYIFDIGTLNLASGKTTEMFVALDKHRIFLDATVPIEELEEYTGNILETPYESSTIGGYLLELTQNIPQPGSEVETQLGTFRILRTKQNRIITLLWTIKIPEKIL